MLKCFILMLSVFAGLQAQAQFSPTIHSKNNEAINSSIRTAVGARGNGLADAYLSKNGNMIGENNQAVVANDRPFFKIKTALTLGGILGEKIERGHAVQVNCVTPKSTYKWGKLQGTNVNGKVEAIKIKGLYSFVKVKGCDYFVQSHHVISKLQTELPAKTQPKSRAVARQAAQ